MSGLGGDDFDVGGSKVVLGVLEDCTGSSRTLTFASLLRTIGKELRNRLKGIVFSVARVTGQESNVSMLFSRVRV